MGNICEKGRIMYTDKEDWLIDYYSRYKNFYISGHDSFSKRIGLSNKESEYLHFIGNKKGIYAYILSIGLDFDRDLEDVKSKVEKSSLIEKIKDVFGSLHVILYDKEVKEQNDFWVLDSTFINMDSKSLEKYFSNINPMLTRNKGTIKNINASINDNFVCNDCVYKPYCGVCPVCNFADQGNIIADIRNTTRCKIFMKQFDWVFKEKFIN